MQEDTSWPAFRLIDENVRATLRAGLPGGILVFSEHLDRSHFPDPGNLAEQVAWIRNKYANSNLDLIIGVGDVPTDLFPGVPLLFLNADPRRKPPNLPISAPTYASVWVGLEAQKTLDLAQRLQPGARRIVVIGDGSPSEDTILTRLRQMHPTNSGDVPITYVTNPDVSEICQRVSELGTDTIVLFTALSRDAHGHPLIPAEVIPKIATASAAPVYILMDMYVGTGAVGGYVASFAEVGKAGGQLGLRLLAGEHPQDILVQNVYLFDWRQLRRWKVSESALPPGSVVLYRQPSLWESNRYYILAVIFLCVAETLLIMALLWQWARKRKFQHSFADQLAFEKMLADLSTTFINLPEDQVGATIEKSLGRIAQFLRLDRITLFEYSPANFEFVVTFSWHSPGVTSCPALIQASQLSWFTSQLQRGETVHLSSLEDLPEEASADKEYLRNLGSISVAAVPLKAGEQLFGAMSFATAKFQMDWTEGLVDQLTLVGEIFSNALARKRALEARFRHAAIVESSDDAIISKNLQGIILSWNAGAQHLFGYTEAEAIGQSIEVLVPEELRDEEQRLLQRARAGERIEHHETIRIAKNGKRLNVSLTIAPMRDSEGAIVGATKIARDITESKRAEQLLRESEDRFRLLANIAPVLIWMSGNDKLCTFFNQSWLTFTGRSLEQETGDGWLSGVHPDDIERCMAIYSSSFEARVDFEMEYRLRRFDGEYRWLVDFGVPRFESDGTFCGYIGSCVDITDRKSSEESLHNLSGRLITAQEEERARIARELHDDFSQRLALLSIELGQLWKKLSPSEIEGRTIVLNMLKGTQEMSSDLHSLSHQLHSSKLEHVGLASALLALCKEIGEKYKIEVHFVQPEYPLNIPKDVALCLFRVAQEALGNVIKHSGAKTAQVEIGVNAAGISLCISDQGKGFDPEIRNPGAGIGLIGMSERLRLVGGRFMVKSEEGCGTEIFAEVPLAVSTIDNQSKTHSVGT